MRLERSRNTRRNFIFGLLQKSITVIFPIFIRTMIIRVLGVEYLGINSLFASIISVLSLAELGFGNALIYSMYEPIEKNDVEMVCALMGYYKKCYRMIGIVIIAAGSCMIPFLDKIISGSYPSGVNIRTVYVITLFSTAMTYFMYAYKTSLLIAFQRNDISLNITSLFLAVQYLAQIILLTFFKDYYIYLLVVPMTNVMTNITIAIIVTKKYPQFTAKGKLSKEKVKEINKKVYALFMYKVGNTVSNSADNIVISAFLGLSVLALYNNYYSLMNSVMSVLLIYYNSMQGGLGNIIASEPLEKIYGLFMRLNSLQKWIIGWMTICFFCLFQPFIKIWGDLAGKDMQLPFGLVICLCLYFYVWKVNDIVHIFKDAAGLWSYDRYRPLIASIFNLTINLILVQRIGLYGVLISTIFTEMIFSIWAIYVLYRSYFNEKLSDYYKGSVFYTIYTFVALGITYAMCFLIQDNGIVAFLIKCIICLLIPNIMYLIIMWITEKEVFYFLIDKLDIGRRMMRT